MEAVDQLLEVTKLLERIAHAIECRDVTKELQRITTADKKEKLIPGIGAKWRHCSGAVLTQTEICRGELPCSKEPYFIPIACLEDGTRVRLESWDLIKSAPPECVPELSE
jgi:hypothetical protein